MAASNDKQVFDVEKPGKTAPSATSRPVITGHGPMMKDPMVSDKPDEASGAEEKIAVKTSGKKLAPMPSADADKKPDAPVSQTESDNQPPAASDDAKDKPAEESKDSAAADKGKANTAAVDAVAEQALKGKDKVPTKEEAERQAALEKLIEEKKYFLSIGKVTRRRHTRTALTVLVLIILLLVGAYLALDAGLIETQIVLPYELIDN